MVKMSKCDFAKQQISYLGHVISDKGVSTDPSKINAVVNWPTPSNVKEVRGFLGLTGYYRKFIKSYGIISKPLTELLRKGVVYVWNPLAQEAFKTLKQALTTAPVLALPDFSVPFEIDTDACESGLGAVLMQRGTHWPLSATLLAREIEDYLSMKRSTWQYFWQLSNGGPICIYNSSSLKLIDHKI